MKGKYFTRDVWEVAMDVESMLSIVDAIDYLRKEEASSVFIPNDNPDFYGPVCFVEVAGEWTGYKARRFEGGNLEEVLVKAADVKEKWVVSQGWMDTYHDYGIIKGILLHKGGEK